MEDQLLAQSRGRVVDFDFKKQNAHKYMHN